MEETDQRHFGWGGEALNGYIILFRLQEFFTKRPNGECARVGIFSHALGSNGDAW